MSIDIDPKGLTLDDCGQAFLSGLKRLPIRYAIA